MFCFFSNNENNIAATKLWPFDGVEAKEQFFIVILMKKRIHHTKPKQKETILFFFHFFALRNAVEIEKQKKKIYNWAAVAATALAFYTFFFISFLFVLVTASEFILIHFAFLKLCVFLSWVNWLFGCMRDSPVHTNLQPFTHSNVVELRMLTECHCASVGRVEYHTV